MTASLFIASEHVQDVIVNVIVAKGKKELSQKPNLCLWGACKFPQRNRRTEKMPRIFATKIQWPEVVHIPGAGGTVRRPYRYVLL